MRSQVLGVALVGLLAACDPPLDTQREVEPYGSFGELVYREVCQRLVYTGQLAQREAGEIDRVDVSGALGRRLCVEGEPAPEGAPPKVHAVQAQRGALVRVVDDLFPDDFLTDLQEFLAALGPLYDQGTMERAIDGMGTVFESMRADHDVPQAFVRFAAHKGYAPPAVADGLIPVVLDNPELDAFLSKGLRLFAPGGTAEAELKPLLAAASRELRVAKAVPDPGDPERTLRLTLDLLTTRRPGLAVADPVLALVRDHRGAARVALSGGAVPAPFVDGDGDGLADVDDDGRYLLQGGEAPTPFPAPGASTDAAERDAEGRALAAGRPIYQTIDLDGTVLSALLDEARRLLDPSRDLLFGLVYGASALFGPRGPMTKAYPDAAGGTLAYEGYDPAKSAVLDLAHAVFQLLGFSQIDGLLQAVSTLVTRHEPELARALSATLDARDRSKLHPEAQLPATSTLYDDLHPHLVRILAVPGLLEDLLAALEDPHVRGLFPMLGRLMRTRNQVDFDRTNAPLFPLRDDLSFEDPVDRSQPDVDDNRSLMQRILHLIHDTNGLSFCNKEGATPKVAGLSLLGSYAKCELFKIEDLGLFFVLNMASDAIRKDTTRRATTYDRASFCEQIQDSGLRAFTGDFLLETLVGIDGFTCFPTPAAGARSIFLRASDTGTSDFLRQTTEPAPCLDGDRMGDMHEHTLYAWEATLPGNPSGYFNDTFYDAIRPIVDAFAKHDECLQHDAGSGACLKAQNAAKIFLDVLGVVHEHWASPKSTYYGQTYQSAARDKPRFALRDNITSYEPLLSELMESADLVPAIIDLVPVLRRLTVDGTAAGPRLEPILVELVRYVMDPSVTPPEVATRDGKTSTVQSDGKTPVPRATPFHLLADALARKNAWLKVAPKAQVEAWDRSLSGLADELLATEPSAGAVRLKDRRLPELLPVALDFLRARLRAHGNAGDLKEWAHTRLTRDLTDVLGGPLFAALGPLAAKVEEDPEARDQVYRFLGRLLDREGSPGAARAVRVVAFDLLQLLLDDRDLVPLARVAGVAMDPTQGTLDAALDLLKGSNDVDQKRVLTELLRRLFVSPKGALARITDIVDVVAELNRRVPGQGGALDAGDYRGLFGEAGEFLHDEKRGFQRLVQIVKSRGPH